MTPLLLTTTPYVVSTALLLVRCWADTRKRITVPSQALLTGLHSKLKRSAPSLVRGWPTPRSWFRVQKGRARSASPCVGWGFHALVVGRHLQNRVAAGAYHRAPRSAEAATLALPRVTGSASPDSHRRAHRRGVVDSRARRPDHGAGGLPVA